MSALAAKHGIRMQIAGGIPTLAFQSFAIEGAVAVAAPFFTSANLVGGSLAVFGPSVRMKEVQVAKIVKILIHESKALSAALGSAVPADLI